MYLGTRENRNVKGGKVVSNDTNIIRAPVTAWMAEWTFAADDDDNSQTKNGVRSEANVSCLKFLGRPCSDQRRRDSIGFCQSCSDIVIANVNRC